MIIILDSNNTKLYVARQFYKKSIDIHKNKCGHSKVDFKIWGADHDKYTWIKEDYVEY